MIDFDPDKFDPPQEILNRCYEVLLSDEKIKNHGVRPVDIKRWALKNCKTFVFMHEQDVSDVSYQFDYVYGFYFGDEKDVNWFKLKWE